MVDFKEVVIVEAACRLAHFASQASLYPIHSRINTGRFLGPGYRCDKESDQIESGNEFGDHFVFPLSRV